MVFAPLKKKLIGDILLDRGVISKEQLDRALHQQGQTDDPIGNILIRLKYAKEEEVIRALAFQKGVPFQDLSKVRFKDELRKIIPGEMAHKFNVMPISKDEDTNTLVIAMENPDDVVIIDEIKAYTKLKISIVCATRKDIGKSIEKFYGSLVADMGDLADMVVEEIGEDEGLDLLEGEYDADDAPIVKYVNSLIHEAAERVASDIHFEPLESSASLRLRVDGKLKELPSPGKAPMPAIVSRIKIMANLDIAERRLPQDGKCRVKVGGKKIDIRVSTLPTIYGEKVVMRLLQRTTSSLDFDDLGFYKENEEIYKEALNCPHGIILVTGPTGSGKTTTLYAGLNYINKPTINIITIEDPVEMELKRINQVQVRPKIDLTFANILRRVLRQDPDVIMVGEIRDRETAEIAIQAALTGHLVLSTLHTNDAVSSLTRLNYMGIEEYLVADAVILVVAQRLIRKICSGCKEEQEVPEELLKKLSLSDSKIEFYHGTGCGECFDTGYRGRTAIYEMLRITPEIKRLLTTGTNELDIKEKAVEQGMITLRDMAIRRLTEGVTTVEEVLTVTFM